MRGNPYDMSERQVRLFQRDLTRYTFMLPYCYGKKVLHVECAQGFGTRILSYVSDVTGIDKSHVAIGTARTHNPNIHFLVRNVESPLWQVGNYDVVVVSEALEKMKEPEKFLGKVRGKTLILSVPIESGEVFNKNPRHLHRFTTKEIQKLLGNCDQALFTLTDRSVETFESDSANVIIIANP